MNLNFLRSLGGPGFQRALLKASKYAPEILTGIGIAATVGSTILIARAATSHIEVKNQNFARITAVKMRKVSVLESGELENDEHPETYNKDLTFAYARNGLDYIKLYGPGISLGVGGVISILAAHGIMKRRLVIMTGAYEAVTAAYKAYRARVVAEHGEDKDRDYALGFYTETVEGEDGKKTKIRTVDPNHYSQYARFFDETRDTWHKDPEYNLLFLRNQQSWANDRLKIQGYLFLMDVYDALGIPRSAESMMVGWTMDPANGGDLFVDFHIYEAQNRDFVNGLERSVLLDFNVEGIILDKI